MLSDLGNSLRKSVSILSALGYSVEKGPIHRTLGPFALPLADFVHPFPPKALTLATLLPEKYPKALMRESLSAVVRQCNWRADNASLETEFAHVQCRQ